MFPRCVRVPSRLPAPPLLAQNLKDPLRRGRWTPEEESYACCIIKNFERGLLQISPGTSLRNYLAEKLHCDPMRITKKFAGDSSVGKRVFHPAPRTPEKVQEMARVHQELAECERHFLGRVQQRKLNGRRPLPSDSNSVGTQTCGGASPPSASRPSPCFLCMFLAYSAAQRISTL